MALIHLNVFSEKLNRNTDLNIVIPADTKLSGRSYPVLYLLHGTYGDYTDWVRKSNVERYAQECGMAVVMPSADNSFYLDHYSGPAYASYISQELYEYLPQLLPLTKDPGNTYIGGLSMGGYGAFYLAAKAPDKYGAAISLCGGFDIVKIMANSSFSPKIYPFDAMFSDYTPERWKEEDVNIGKLLCRSKESGIMLPRLYIAVGQEDITYEANQDLTGILKSKGIAFTYEEGPGRHEWDYWDKQIRRAMIWLKEGEKGTCSETRGRS